MRTLALVVAFGIAAAAQESSSSRPVFRVGAELVVIDLVATDRDGRFVEDLSPADIHLTVDGKPQQVQFLHLVRMGRVARQGATSTDTAAAPAASPDETRASDPVSSVSLVIAMDLAGIPADALPRVKDAIRRMVLDELPANSQVMFVTLFHGVQIHQPFTADRGAILSAVDRIPVTAASQGGFMYLLDRAEQACSTMGPDKIFEHLSALGRSAIPEMQTDYLSTSESIAALARSMRAASGRKHIVLYSMGYAVDPISAAVEVVGAAAAACTGADDVAMAQRFRQDFSSLQRPDPAGTIQDTIDQANRAQLSVYAIDPRGLSTNVPQSTQGVGARGARRGMVQKTANLDVVLPQEYLRAIAANTGGSAFLNSNDLAAGLRRAWMDAGEYYLAGYTPTSSRKKKTFHKIELRVSRPGLNLRYRQGYYESTGADMATEDIKAALQFPPMFERAGFDVEATQERDSLRVVTYVPPHALSFRSEGGERQAVVSVYAVVHDPRGKSRGTRMLFAKDFSLRLDDRKYAELLASDNVQISNTVTAPAEGNYTLTVVARDSGGWLAARTIDLSVSR